MSARHVETVLPPRRGQVEGERHVATMPSTEATCRHDDPLGLYDCCHGGHGRHVAIPRHAVRWPSSSQAGLASFRPDPWGNDPDRTTRRETYR